MACSARCATRSEDPPKTLARVTMLLILSSCKAAKRPLIHNAHYLSEVLSLKGSVTCC